MKFLAFLLNFRPLGSGEAVKSGILAENGSEIAENGAGKGFRRSIQAVAPSSPSMSPWGCMWNPFGTELAPEWDPQLRNCREKKMFDLRSSSDVSVGNANYLLAGHQSTGYRVSLGVQAFVNILDLP